MPVPYKSRKSTAVQLPTIATDETISSKPSVRKSPTSLVSLTQRPWRLGCSYRYTPSPPSQELPDGTLPFWTRTELVRFSPTLLLLRSASSSVKVEDDPP